VKFARGLHLVNLCHITCVHGILENTPNFSKYCPKRLLLKPLPIPKPSPPNHFSLETSLPSLPQTPLPPNKGNILAYFWAILNPSIWTHVLCILPPGEAPVPPFKFNIILDVDQASSKSSWNKIGYVSRILLSNSQVASSGPMCFHCTFTCPMEWFRRLISLLSRIQSKFHQKISFWFYLYDILVNNVSIIMKILL